MSIGKNIAKYRKAKGLTQEELGAKLGVTNQSVSKWESAQCCPDIQLLPAIAKVFDVSVDELLGYRPTEGLGEICLKIRRYFAELPEKEVFENAFRIAALLHEAAATDGYKKKLHWREGIDYASESVHTWGVSICSEPEGVTIRRKNCVFLSSGNEEVMPSTAQLRNLNAFLSQVNDINVLKVLYALHRLTIKDFSVYVSKTEIAQTAGVTEEKVEAAFEEIPVEVRDDGGAVRYRLEGAYYHVPPVLSLMSYQL